MFPKGPSIYYVSKKIWPQSSTSLVNELVGVRNCLLIFSAIYTDVGGWVKKKAKNILK